MPIAILEIPKGKIIPKGAADLCKKTGDRLHDKLGVPEPEDKEIRIIRGNSDETILRFAYTRGPNEYPKKDPSHFFPSELVVSAAGDSILEIIKDLRFDVSRVVIEAWRNTTFVIREEGKTDNPVTLIPAEELEEARRYLSSPRIKLVLSPKERQGGTSLKEFGSSQEDGGHQEVASKLSKLMKETLGLEDTRVEVEFAEFADTDITVEFDCDVKPDKLIPEKVRQFMAESCLQILNTSQSTREGSAEVWIRQGKPEVGFDRRLTLPLHEG